MIHSSEEPDAKKAKEDEEEDEYNLANIAEGSVTSVRVRGNWLSPHRPHRGHI